MVMPSMQWLWRSVILYPQKYILVSCKLVLRETAYSSLEIDEEPYKRSLDAMMDCFNPEGEYIPEKVKSKPDWTITNHQHENGAQ